MLTSSATNHLIYRLLIIVSLILLFAILISINEIIGFIFLIFILGLFVFIIGIQFPEIPFYILIGSFALGSLLKTELLPTTFMIIPGALAIACFSINLTNKRTRFTFPLKIAWPWIVFLGWVIIIGIYYQSIDIVRPYIFVFILFVLSANVIRSPANIKGFAWTIVISLTITCLVVIIQKFFFSMYDIDLVLGDKNIVSMYILVGLPFIFFLLKTTKLKILRVLFICNIAILLIAITLLLSIGAFVGLLVLLLSAFFTEKNLKYRFLIIVILLITILLGIFGPLSTRINQQIDVFKTDDPGNWMTYRGMLWEASIDMINQNPLIGYGTYKNIHNQFMQSPYLDTWIKIYFRNEELQSHNSFLTVACQFGLIGLLFFSLGITNNCYFLVRLLKSININNPNSKLLIFGNTLLISLISILVQSMALTVPVDKYFWALLGAIHAYHKIVEKNN